MNGLLWQAATINKVWHVINVITDETIEVTWEEKARQLAIRLNINKLATYASIGEFDWRVLTSGSNYLHAAMPNSRNPLDCSLSLCDRPARGVVGFNSPYTRCPECLKEIETINDGFKPMNDPYCLKWQQGKTDSGILYIQMNNLDYADYLIAGV